MQLTLFELQQQVRQTLVERFVAPVWVTAEIHSLRVHHSGHCYLELVEKGSRDGIPKAQARATIWRSQYTPLAARFLHETGQPLAAGMQVLLSVLVSYHELHGFSLQVINIDPAYTLGDMERQRQQTIARLQEEGIWELNRRLVLPTPTQRIALVSSAQAAGYQDFCNELKRSPYAFRLTLFEAVMQGAQAEESLCAALTAIAEQQEAFDAVVIVRGGGATSDLNCFNSYRLCSYIAQFPLPVVTGIGHDRDQSVADMVAHTPLKTPTAVAAWLTERMGTIDRWLEDAARLVEERTKRLLQDETLRLERAQSRLHSSCREGLMRAQMRLEKAATRLPDAVSHLLEREQLRLRQAAVAVESRSPQAILKLGFAVVRGKGRALRSIEELKRHERLQIELADGTMEIQNSELKIQN